MSIIGTTVTVTPELEKDIQENLTVKKIVKVYSKHERKPKQVISIIRPYQVNGNNTLSIPMYWAMSKGIPRQPKTDYQSFPDVQFTGKLNDQQITVKNDAIQNLNKFGTCLLSLHVGFGKTVLAVYLASKIKLKTLIITHRVVLADQWAKAIANFSSNPEGMFTICSPGKVEPNSDYGFVIVDELHSILAEGSYVSLLAVAPRFLLGLSATPIRPDNTHTLINFFFNPESYLHRELYFEHTVYTIKTEYKYPIDASDFTELINAQSFNEPRNEYITGLILGLLESKEDQRNVLVLCRRNEQAKWIYKRLTQSTDLLINCLTGTTNKYDQNARVIIGTYSKCSYGFSCDSLNTLVLASDVISSDTDCYMVQIIGRILRTRLSVPIIYDLVDQNPVFEKHYKIRCKTYTKCGGKIINSELHSELHSEESIDPEPQVIPKRLK
jgi:superfamily II DNA or RNA helicase